MTQELTQAIVDLREDDALAMVDSLLAEGADAVGILADCKAAERISVEAERDDLLDRPSPQLGVDPSLRDPEAELPRRARLVDLALAEA